MFTALRDKSDADVKTIVEELAKQSHAKGTVNQKIADYYNAPSNTAELDKLGLAPEDPTSTPSRRSKTHKELAQRWANGSPHRHAASAWACRLTSPTPASCTSPA